MVALAQAARAPGCEPGGCGFEPRTSPHLSWTHLDCVMHAIQVQNETMFTNPSAPPGKSQQYAKRERERRFLLAEPPAGKIERTTTITDRYFLGTRLRLRLMVETRGAASRTYYKLTQKIPAADGGPGLLSTTYLNEEEFALLSTLPGSVLRKTRYSIPPFGVDVFDSPLDGLILAECEFDDDATMHSFTPPAWILAEVTLDARFGGGRLATLDTSGLVKLLAPFGVVRAAD
jgi:CYTH domain-containing protein